MRVRFSLRARADLDAIADHLERLNPAGARKVLADIRAAIDLVADHPERAEQTDMPAILVKIGRRYRYLVFYRIDADAIDIAHIRRSAGQPWPEPGD